MKGSLGSDPEESLSLSSQIKAASSKEVAGLGQAGTWQEMLDWECEFRGLRDVRLEM